MQAARPARCPEPAGSLADAKSPPSQSNSHCNRLASSGASNIAASGMNRLAPNASLMPPIAMHTSKTTMPIRSADQSASLRCRIQADIAAIDTPMVASPISGKTISTLSQP